MKTWVCMPSPIQVTCACRWQLVQQRTHMENNWVKFLYMNPYQWSFGHGHGAWSLRHVQLNRSSQVWRRRNGCRYTATVMEAQLYQLSRSLVRLHTYVRIIIQVSWNDAKDISTIFIIVAPGVPIIWTPITETLEVWFGGLIAIGWYFAIRHPIPCCTTTSSNRQAGHVLVPLPPNRSPALWWPDAWHKRAHTKIHKTINPRKTIEIRLGLLYRYATVIPLAICHVYSIF